MTPEECMTTLERWFGSGAVEAINKLIAQRGEKSRSLTQQSEFHHKTRHKRPSRRRVKARLRQGKWVSKLELVEHDLTSFMLKFPYEAHDYLFMVRRIL